MTFKKLNNVDVIFNCGVIPFISFLMASDLNSALLSFQTDTAVAGEERNPLEAANGKNGAVFTDKGFLLSHCDSNRLGLEPK